MTLDKIAQHAKVRVAFVFDEFQEVINLVKATNAYQGAIRHAVGRAQNITYIFSGSKHEALQTLFTGKKNPLYELCNLMPLSLISTEYYQDYLNQVSEKRWGQPITDSVIKRILHYTNCYPKYVNALCLLLWSSSENPTVNLVDMLWEEFMFSRRSSVRDELNSLKMSARRLLKSLRLQKTKEPTGLEYSNFSLVPSSTASRVVKELILKDFIYIDQDGYYRPIDPTYQSYFTLFG